MKRTNRRSLAWLMTFGVALGTPVPAFADGYLVRSGWVCQGSSPRFPAVTVQVIYQGIQDGVPYFRLRLIQGQKEDGSDAETVLAFHRAQESVSAPGILSYRSEIGAENANLTLRLIDGSDQSLPGNLRIMRSSGAAEVIPRLLCNKSRP